MSRYTTVSIPETLAYQIDEALNKPPRPYRSRSDFATDAIRRLLEQLEASHDEEG